MKCLTPDRSRAHRQPRGNLDAITTVPMGKLHKNTNQDKASFLSTKQKEKELALEKAQVAESSPYNQPQNSAKLADLQSCPYSAILKLDWLANYRLQT